MVGRKRDGIRRRAAGVAAAALGVALGAGCGHDPPRSSGIAIADAGAEGGAAADASAGDARPAFTIVESRSTRIATSTADPRFAVEVDCDDETTDDRYFGIAPVIDG